jgi:adenylate kinase family enzyme
MTRIMVIGNAGNGKTTLCKKLGAGWASMSFTLTSPRAAERWLQAITL